MAQVAGIQVQAARGEIVQCCQRRGQPCIVQDHPFEMAMQMAAADQVVADHRAEAKAKRTLAVMGQASVAFHHHHIEPIPRVAQYAGVLAGKQVVEHLRATAGDVGQAGVPGEALRGVQLAQAANAGGRVGEAGTGEAPGTDGGADQRALARRARQPFAEDRQVQPLDAERFRTTRGAGQDADIGRRQALLTDAPQRTGSGLEGEGGGLDLDGSHAGASLQQEPARACAASRLKGSDYKGAARPARDTSSYE
ncbi:hypothetical protein D3C81_1470980 [compost metagenome]